MIWLLLFALLYLAPLLGASLFPGEQTLEVLLNYRISAAWSVLLAVSFIGARRTIGRSSVSLIIGGYLLFSLLLSLYPPLFSSDLFLYALQGRAVSVHGLNPYRVPACLAAADPVLHLVYPPWSCRPPAYGPLLVLLHTLVASLCGTNVVALVCGFRALAFLGATVAIALVYAFLSSRQTDPEKLHRALYLLAWNPVVLIECVNNAHNDIWMVVLGLAALVAIERLQGFLSLVFLTLAVLTKYLYGAIVPLLVLRVWKRGGMRSAHLVVAVAGLALIALLILVVSGAGGAAVALSRHIDVSHPAFFNVTILVGSMIGVSLETARGLGLAVGLALIAAALICVRDVSSCAAWLLVAAALFIPPSLLPWYALWWLPFFVLGGDEFQVLFWSAAALLSYTIAHYSFATAALEAAPIQVVYWIWRRRQKIGSLPPLLG